MAFRGNSYKPKTKKKKGSLYYPYTDEDMKRVGWCMSKGIKIAVVPNWKGNKFEWQVEIIINGKSNLDPKIYTGKEALIKMYEYYKYYYDKNIS